MGGDEVLWMVGGGREEGRQAERQGSLSQRWWRYARFFRMNDFPKGSVRHKDQLHAPRGELQRHCAEHRPAMSTTGFQRALDHIRSISETEAQKGRLFERLMQAYFREDPLYQERFSQVWLWQEWVPHFNEEEARRAAPATGFRPPLRFHLNDTGIDLVARERDGGWSAIQCECYAPGTRIAKKHLDYEDDDFPRYPLEIEPDIGRELRPEDYRLDTRPMRFADKDRRDTRIVNDRVRLTGVSREAHYVVNGLPPLEWLMFCHYRRTNRRSGIVNDPNGWFDDPRELVPAIERLVHVSVETERIVAGLLDPMPVELAEFTIDLGEWEGNDSHSVRPHIVPHAEE